MENDYSKELIQTYKDKQNTIKANLLTWGNFPNRSNPLKKLAPAEEFLLKATYALRVGFLQEFTFLFAYIYSKQKFEKAVLSLEQQGYIKSQQSKDYGKYWVLSSTALYYITTTQAKPFAECNLKDDTFPSAKKLPYYKEINGYFCQRVFSKRTNELMASYHNQEHDMRISYQKEQFIKAYLFPNTTQNYTKEAANQFVRENLDKLETDEEIQMQYMEFIRAFKANETFPCVNHTLLQFAFLKDYFNASGTTREESVLQTFKIFFGIFQTLFRGDAFTSRITLNKSLGSEDVKKDLELFMFTELVSYLTMQKRNLSKTKPSTEEEASLLTLRLDSLEKKISTMKKIISQREEDFELMIFDTMKNDIPAFKSSIVTLKSLADLQCHIVGMTKPKTSRPVIVWGIFQPNNEDFSVSALFTRIERIYQYQMHHLPMSDFRFIILTTSQAHEDAILRKLDIVKESFEEIGHYGLLLFHFDEIEVISTRQQMKERYEIFKDFKALSHF